MSRHVSMGGEKTVVWFRRDLRVEDNPALSAAARAGSIFPVFIWCPNEEGDFYPGRGSRWWLKQSLHHLNHSLQSLGAELLFIKTDSTLSSLLDCVNAVGATAVSFSHLYDPVSLVRDYDIKENLAKRGVSVLTYNADLLFEPWEISDKTGHAFTRFSAFWKECMNVQSNPVFHLPPWRLLQSEGKVNASGLEELGLENDAEKSSNMQLGKGWQPGWSNADKALTGFMENHLIDYANNRMKAGACSTSFLSPYLHFGELSVRKVYDSARKKLLLWTRDNNTTGCESATLFLKSIGLREYSRYLCFNFPYTHERSLMMHLKFFPWEASERNFKAWRQGKTGYPLVDAGMRELWATGWLHNRIRIVVSSFCVKVLLLPWKWGMKYFWDTLLDADLESDILGWQYISGSLPDGHELERLDSPELQGSKYDPNGEYVRQWLPELARMPTEWIHHPWNAPLAILKAAGVELGQNYPNPIVDLDSAMEHLNQAIARMWELHSGARVSSLMNDDKEVVGDNEEPSESVSISKVVLRPSISVSLNDQKVPSGLNNIRKRGKLVEETESRDSKRSGSHRRGEDDLNSTAESFAVKETTGGNTFSVPQVGSSTDVCPMQDLESSEVNQRMDFSDQHHYEIGHSSNNDN